MQEVTITSVEELDHFADVLLGEVPKGLGASVIALVGNLGAGKTTLTQAIARRLNIPDIVTSPTFIIMKRYGAVSGGWRFLIHVDAYRVDDAKEFAVVKLLEILARPDNLVVIEWADRIPKSIPKDALWVYMESIDETSRKISYGQKTEQTI